MINNLFLTNSDHHLCYCLDAIIHFNTLICWLKFQNHNSLLKGHLGIHTLIAACLIFQNITSEWSISIPQKIWRRKELRRCRERFQLIDTIKIWKEKWISLHQWENKKVLPCDYNWLSTCHSMTKCWSILWHFIKSYSPYYHYEK